MNEVKTRYYDLLNVEEMVDLIIEEYMSGKAFIMTIPDRFVNEQLIDAIILKNPMDIQFVSEKLLSDENYKKVLNEDGVLLGLIPEPRRTLELCQVAISSDAYAIKFVPEILKSLVIY